MGLGVCEEFYQDSLLLKQSMKLETTPDKQQTAVEASTQAAENLVILGRALPFMEYQLSWTQWVLDIIIIVTPITVKALG